MEIEFQGYLDKETIFKAFKIANRPSKRSAVIRISLAVFFVLFFLFSIYSIIAQANPSIINSLRSSYHLLLFPFIIYFVLQPYFTAYLAAKKYWKRPTVHQPLTGTISSQRIVYIWPSERIEVSWSKYVKKHTDDQLIVMATEDGLISIFPRRFFKTESEWHTVTLWVNAKVMEVVS